MRTYDEIKHTWEIQMQKTILKWISNKYGARMWTADKKANALQKT